MVQAQDHCSTTIARSTYAVVRQGNAIAGEDNAAMSASATELRTVVFDGEGSVSSDSLNLNISSVFSDQDITGGSSIVNPGC